MFTRPQSRNMIDANDPQVSKFGHPAPPWLVNYADLMTELVCFFIILYALSAVLYKNIQEAKRQMDKIIKEENLQMDITMTKEGVRFSLEEKGKNAYFEVGKADLTPQMIHILSKIAPVLKNMPNEIVIEGHTDNVPINNSEMYPSNWELSSARAISVLQHLLQNYNVEPNRVSAVGFGEFRPCALNDTPEHRARNRRVVFFIKSVPPKSQISSDPSSTTKSATTSTTAPPSETPVASSTAPPASEAPAAPAVEPAPTVESSVAPSVEPAR
jgi:chemotaxis protein MotB